MVKFGVGQPIRRVEDQRFLTGHGRYTDDVNLPGQAYAYILRSPHAHADFTFRDVAAARAAPGVLAVLTGAEYDADGLGLLPCKAPVKNRDGKDQVVPPRRPLTIGTVRYVGDAVAMVIAATPAQARDAAELIEIDWRDKPAVTDTAGAVEPGAPQVWPELKNNVSFDWENGNKDKTDAAFKRAAHTVKLRLINNRVIANSVEMRGALGAYDPATERYTLYTSSQGSHSVRGMMATDVFKVKTDRIRVVTPDVGGGFGMKLFCYPEYVLAAWAAKRVGRPVKWTCERSDAFLSDTHGRDNVTDAELAVDAQGKFLAMRCTTYANMGAYLSDYAPFVATGCGTDMLVGVYTIEAAYVRVLGTFTHTVPVDAYRGAGRPEAAYVVERMVDAAARQLKLPVDEIRRRNFIPPRAMPYKTAMAWTYDSGEFEQNMTKAMRLADWPGFAARRAESKKRGRLRGIGMSYYIETCGMGPGDTATIKVEADGKVTILIGTQSNGQGHETAYTQIVSEKLGVPAESIRVFQGDTDMIPIGNGTGGSRSLPEGGVALDKATLKVIEKGRKIAAHVLETAEADIEFADGRFTVAGTDRSLTILDVGRIAADPKKIPAGLDTGLDGADEYASKAPTFPHGCHICEIEIDPETGKVTPIKHTVVDDFGRMINPLLLEGQIHGGVVQGYGQALYERAVYDSDSGQLLTGSFMDYCMPRADLVPPITFDTHNVPCTTNPLGLKGCGEAGAIGAPPAVVNAVVDALAPYGVTHIDMPATAAKIWQAIHGAAAARAAE
jgi:carbon-monoxide dehydrogenase large subunit